MAAAEWGSHDGFRANRARELVEALHRCADTIAAHIGLCGAGPIDPRIRGLLGRHNEFTAHAFAQACSTAFWCLGASCKSVLIGCCYSTVIASIAKPTRDPLRVTARTTPIRGRRRGGSPSTAPPTSSGKPTRV